MADQQAANTYHSEPHYLPAGNNQWLVIVNSNGLTALEHDKKLTHEQVTLIKSKIPLNPDQATPEKVDASPINSRTNDDVYTSARLGRYTIVFEGNNPENSKVSRVVSGNLYVRDSGYLLTTGPRNPETQGWGNVGTELNLKQAHPEPITHNIGGGLTTLNLKTDFSADPKEAKDFADHTKTFLQPYAGNYRTLDAVADKKEIERINAEVKRTTKHEEDRFTEAYMEYGTMGKELAQKYGISDPSRLLPNVMKDSKGASIATTLTGNSKAEGWVVMSAEDSQKYGSAGAKYNKAWDDYGAAINKVVEKHGLSTQYMTQIPFWDFDAMEKHKGGDVPGYLIGARFVGEARHSVDVALAKAFPERTLDPVKDKAEIDQINAEIKASTTKETKELVHDRVELLKFGHELATKYNIANPAESKDPMRELQKLWDKKAITLEEMKTFSDIDVEIGQANWKLSNAVERVLEKHRMTGHLYDHQEISGVDSKTSGVSGADIRSHYEEEVGKMAAALVNYKTAPKEAGTPVLPPAPVTGKNQARG